jgi:hypothetical protein
MLNEMVKNLDITRSELIRRAVLHYRDVLEKEKLKVQIKKASLKSRADSLKVLKEFDNILDDGLKDV